MIIEPFNQFQMVIVTGMFVLIGPWVTIIIIYQKYMKFEKEYILRKEHQNNQRERMQINDQL